MKIVDYALFYASKGWRVFPCKPKDKVPACKWKDEATIDPDNIRAWWGTNSEYNIGIKCGKESNLFVLDIDPDKGGHESLLTLIADYAPLPLSVEQITGGGGRHVFFTYPSVTVGNSAGKLGPGLDTRGDGGYIVAPPSIHPSGRQYEWEVSSKPSQTELATIPPWLLDLLTGIDKPNGKHEEADNYTGTIREGERNQALASMAGSMRRRGFDNEAIFAALIEHNARHCYPPLSNDEVSIISKSITRYAPTSLYRGKNTDNGIVPHEPQTAYDSGLAFIELLFNLEGRSIPTFITPIDDCLGGLERQTLTVLAARPSMGKSTLAWQICRNIAAHGLKSYFFSLEMSTNNLWAKAACGSLGYRWRDVRSGKASEDDLEKLAAEVTRLMEIYGVNLLIDDRMNTTETISEMCKKLRPDLLVVDHLRLVADENASEVQRLGNISAGLKSIAKEYNCAALVLAQLNRNVEQRGVNDRRPQLADLRESGHIEENADTVLMMYRQDYYEDDKPPAKLSETELLVRKFRDDIMSQRIKLTYNTERQWFTRQGEMIAL